MKFIFPQNYNFKSKLFGFIDYSTVILNLVWGVIVFGIVFFLIPNITMKIGVFIILFCHLQNQKKILQKDLDKTVGKVYNKTNRKRSFRRKSDQGRSGQSRHCDVFL